MGAANANYSWNAHLWSPLWLPLSISLHYTINELHDLWYACQLSSEKLKTRFESLKAPVWTLRSHRLQCDVSNVAKPKISEQGHAENQHTCFWESTHSSERFVFQLCMLGFPAGRTFYVKKMKKNQLETTLKGGSTNHVSSTQTQSVKFRILKEYISDKTHIFKQINALLEQGEELQIHLLWL